MAKRTKRQAKTAKQIEARPAEAPTPEQMAKGDVVVQFVTHVETNTITKAHRVSSIVERWFAEGWPGFDEPARAAIDWCHVRWEARGIIGKQCANYSPTNGAGGNAGRDMELTDELDMIKNRFPAPFWRVFENVVRWGQPAGTCGSSMAKNGKQAISSARATVGMIANMIAMELRL